MKFALAYPDRPQWPKFDWVRDAVRATVDPDAFAVRNAGELAEASQTVDVVLFCNHDAGIGYSNIVNAARVKRKALWLHWWFDILPDSVLGGTHHNAIRAMQAMDLLLVKHRHLEPFAPGIRSAYFDQGCPSWIAEVEHQAKPSIDVLLPGVMSGRRSRREDVAKLASAGFRVAVCGHASDAPPRGVQVLPFVPVKDLANLVSDCGIVLDVGITDAIDGYWSDRNWIAMGMGACLLRRDSLGAPKLSYRAYSTHGDLIDQTKALLAKRATRAKIGREARSQVMAKHTYEHRIRELVKLCKKELKSACSRQLVPTDK